MPLRFTIQAPPGVSLLNDPNEFAVSPDGSMLAFVAADSAGQGTLWVRDFGRFEARELPGTRNAFLPFWSPDSRQVGFFADGKLRKMRVSGGNPEVICDAATGRGASWSRDGTIVFSPAPTGPLFKVASGGGVPERATVLDSANGESAHRWPCILPDGDHFTFAALPDRGGQYPCYVGSLRSGGSTSLLSTNGAPVFASPEHLVFHRGGALLAQRFDPGRRKVSGEPFAIGDPPGGTNYTAAPGVSSSRSGVLAWMSAGKLDTELLWVDRTGRRVGKVDVPLDQWGQCVLSPDGRRAVIEQTLPTGDSDLWVIDLERGTTSRLTFQTRKNTIGAWSPDGSEIIFASTRKGRRDLYRRASDGSGSDHLLYESSVPFKTPTDWSQDGLVVFGEISDETGWNLLTIPAGGGAPTPYLVTPFDELGGLLSPDGRWLLYSSSESGNSQLYIQSFPVPGRKQQVTRTGAFFGEFSRDGREIFLLRTDLMFVSIPVQETPDGFSFGPPRELFRVSQDIRSIAAAADGQRFLIAVPAERTVPGISVAVNWRHDENLAGP
jgi:Tol biopolymer transport system component